MKKREIVKLDLVSSMISNDRTARPEASEVLRHPYLWSNSRKLGFLQKFSDTLLEKDAKSRSHLVQKVESGAHKIIGNDLFTKLDEQLIDDLRKNRTYVYQSHRLYDLLRALRNKNHLYSKISPNVNTELGSYPNEFYSYFERKFPKLLFIILLKQNYVMILFSKNILKIKIMVKKKKEV